MDARVRRLRFEPDVLLPERVSDAESVQRSPRVGPRREGEASSPQGIG